jgi:hypothetical protein
MLPDDVGHTTVSSKQRRFLKNVGLVGTERGPLVPSRVASALAPGVRV